MVVDRYKSDSKLNCEQRHTAAISDAGHAAVASCATCLLSADDVFVHKARALYEFLEVTAEVGPVSWVDGEIAVKREQRVSAPHPRLCTSNQPSDCCHTAIYRSIPHRTPKNDNAATSSAIAPPPKVTTRHSL